MNTSQQRTPLHCVLVYYTSDWKLCTGVLFEHNLINKYKLCTCVLVHVMISQQVSCVLNYVGPFSLAVYRIWAPWASYTTWTIYMSAICDILKLQGTGFVCIYIWKYFENRVCSLYLFPNPSLCYSKEFVLLHVEADCIGLTCAEVHIYPGNNQLEQVRNS